MRRTSALVYEELKRTGFLPRSRWRIYEWLYQHGPATAREVFAGLGIEAVQQTRFNELERQGAIAEVRERPCRITGKVVTEWDVTNLMPVKLKKQDAPKKPSKATVHRAIEDIRAQYRRGAGSDFWACSPETKQLMEWLKHHFREGT